MAISLAMLDNLEAVPYDEPNLLGEVRSLRLVKLPFVAISFLSLFLLGGCGGSDNDDIKPTPTINSRPSNSQPSPTVQVLPTIAATIAVSKATPVITGNYFDNLPEFEPLNIENVRYGGTLRSAESASPPHFDPKNLQSSVMGQALYGFYEKVIGWSANPNDKYSRLEPILAEDWKLSPDLKTLTISLRKGVKWHNIAPVNGREFVADDVVFSINRYREPDAATVADYKQIESVEALDKNTVVIRLKDPNAWILDELFGRSEYVVAREVVMASGGSISTTLVGTGPYLLTSYNFRRSWSGIRNPDYWRKDAKGRQLPYIDTIELTEMTDQATMLAALRTNQIDILGTQFLPENVISAAKTIPGLQVVNLKLTVASPAIGFNTKKAPWNDIRARRGFSMAFDRSKWIEGQFGATSPWTYSAPVPWEFVSVEPFMPDKLGPYQQFNPTESKKLLEEAGFPNGRMTITAPLFFNYPGRSTNAVLVQQLFKDQGINFPISYLDGTTFGSQYYQRVHGDLGFAYKIGAAYNLNWYAQNKYLIDASQNTSFIDDPQVTAVVKAIKTTTDPAKLREQAKFLWDFDLNGAWNVWLPYPSTLAVRSPRTRNWLERFTTTSMARFPWLTDAPRTTP
ncbi:MAG: ABC transporter substrate-binding protein [Dehalococcoidia bacterium]|nr:ABC transporter substrate-binding protein [Dehalococcoidia bacterium]